MKVKLFTHTDLDGIGCVIIAKLAFPTVDIEYCNYDDINEKILNYMTTDGYKNFDLTYITDISVNEKVAEIIDEICKPESFVLLDHHKTALWLNKYRWTCISEYIDENTKHSGTEMLYHNIINYYINEVEFRHVDLTNAFDFVEIVRQYDTWEFKTKYNNILPKQVNDLMYLLGRDEFIDNAIYQIIMLHEYKLTVDNFMLLKKNQEKIDKYIESKEKTIIVKVIQGYKAGVVFAEQYHSELGNKLSEMHPELDFIAMINPSHSISYRTVKKNIDLSVIADSYKGGGHAQASGSPISKEMKNSILDLLF